MAYSAQHERGAMLTAQPEHWQQQLTVSEGPRRLRAGHDPPGLALPAMVA
jgi:hypothetical protein